MKILKIPSKMQEWRSFINRSKSVGFVPTMGALHEGHLSLVRRSRGENDLTVASVFVNPTQFGPKEDFRRYPRPWARDRRLLEKNGVQILFAPEANAMYPGGAATRVSVSGLTDGLCGSPRSRGPGHFEGVATIVAKLFNIVRPTRAYFGMKDFQQVRVIERMNEDLNFGVKVVRCPTVREADGLALSSRNAYLSREERTAAPLLHQALQRGAKLLRSTPGISPRALCRKVQSVLESNPHFKIDYVELVSPETLQRIGTIRRPALLAAAVFLGKTRLIDNILVS